MKTYTITVNGVAYDVTVEEGTAQASGAPKAAPKAVPKASAPSAPKASGSKGSVKIESPMPGKILAVKKKAGDAVKKGEAILVLEAMKMENDIVAPQDGTICSIEVAQGAAVESGAVLATLN